MTVPRASFAVIVLAIAAACGTPPTPPAEAAAPAAAPTAAEAPASGDQVLAGTVAEAVNAGEYTYVRLQTAKGDLWLAATTFTVAKGEKITATIDMPMENFHSKSLNKDFPVLYFVSAVAREGESLPAASAAPAMASSHGAGGAAVPVAEQQPVVPVEPPPGGMSIADVWAKRAALSGKTVLIRGTVVKVNNQIMGKNWFHLQDGSGVADKRTNDLTITTSAMVKVGDVVTVSGTLATDKDFGAGYAYDAIVENATVTVK
jgi:hypothetical protein